MESSLLSTSNVHEIEPELQPHMDINSDAQYGLTLVKDTTRKGIWILKVFLNYYYYYYYYYFYIF